MQRLLLMVRKDLLRQLRSPMSILLVLSFPLIFTSLLALTFGSGSEPGVPKVKLLVEDHDDSFLSRALLSVTGSEQMAEFFRVAGAGHAAEAVTLPRTKVLIHTFEGILAAPGVSALRLADFIDPSLDAARMTEVVLKRSPECAPGMEV